MMAHVRATVAQYERRLISQRTRETPAVRRAAGVKLGGSARRVLPEAEARARVLRASGLTVHAEGDALSADGHAGPTGGSWHPSSLQHPHPRVGACRGAPTRAAPRTP